MEFISYSLLFPCNSTLSATTTGMFSKETVMSKFSFLHFLSLTGRMLIYFFQFQRFRLSAEDKINKWNELWTGSSSRIWSLYQISNYNQNFHLNCWDREKKDNEKGITNITVWTLSSLGLIRKGIFLVKWWNGLVWNPVSVVMCWNNSQSDNVLV